VTRNEISQKLKEKLPININNKIDKKELLKKLNNKKDIDKNDNLSEVERKVLEIMKKIIGKMY
jgi:hypothetical protein